MKQLGIVFFHWLYLLDVVASPQKFDGNWSATFFFQEGKTVAYAFTASFLDRGIQLAEGIYQSL